MIEKYMRMAEWKKQGLKPLYLLVTKDKYQLPLAVADTAEELAQIVGVSAPNPSTKEKTAGISEYTSIWRKTNESL